MPLQSGSRLGQYEVLAPLGAGGMGEVYRARDTKLGRDVALKVLSDVFALDKERMSRFRREAQLLASLNHAHIATIYGVEESEGRTALVLEYVDGETLGERIAKGPLQLHEALKIALQISEALEAAHEKTIIHRDLKPANVKITSQGVVKVLDFGLAKAIEPESATAENLSHSPTMSATMTGVGIILGTAAYMAPEQARGKPVDRRADIWAFGVVLFEMLTAHRSFEGETVNDTLAKVIERDPDWTRLPPRIPGSVRNLLQRCLVKNPKDRLQAIGDTRILLEELLSHPESMTAEFKTVPYPRWKKLVPWAVAPLFLVAGWMLKPSPPPAELSVSRTEYSLPGGQLRHGSRHGVALSPDGKRMAFVQGRLATQETPAEPPKIYLRTLDQWDATPIASGSGQTANPFFSPDGQWLGFISASSQPQQLALKKISLAGGAPITLLDRITDTPTGITWGKDGTIVFAKRTSGGLSIIPDSGGEEKEFTVLDQAASEVSHRLPHFLPDGSGVLFTVLRYKIVTPDWKRAQVWVKSLKTGSRKLLLEDALDARYVEGGYLVFARQARLFAVRFDLETLELKGSPVPILDGVTHAQYQGTATSTSGAAQFSVASDGTLLYAPGSIEPPTLESLLWVDRRGSITPSGVGPLTRLGARLSPDGSQIAFNEYYVNKDVWLFDIQRGTLSRQTFEGQHGVPQWSPDGKRLAIRSDRTGPATVYVKELNSQEMKQLTPGPNDSPASWTPDGKEVLYVHQEYETNDASNNDIFAVPVDQPLKVRPVLNSRFNETYPEVSPDGHWLAFCSNETGRSELYVQAYPGPGRHVPISSEGATEPAWSRDGKELYFRSGTKMMLVRFKVSGVEFLAEKPIVLFDSNFGTATPIRSYDVSADGRFLMRRALPDQAEERARTTFPSTLRIVLHWTEELRRVLTPAP